MKYILTNFTLSVIPKFNNILNINVKCLGGVCVMLLLPGHCDVCVFSMHHKIDVFFIQIIKIITQMIIKNLAIGNL